MNLSLTGKFNLVLLLIFSIGFAVTAYISNALLLQNAREEVMQDARILMESALASRAYTIKHVKPLLETQMKYQMIPESVPSYAATESLAAVRAKFPEYTYKEATLNPTNPRDRAAGWEVDVVQALRNNADLPEVVGDREDVGGAAIYIARPLKIKDAACLVCHSTVDVAPKTLVDAYGPNNGFGWNFQETVGAQIVTVPQSLALKRAHSALVTFLASLFGVFVMIFITFNVMLRFIITKPVLRLAKFADSVSMGHLEEEDIPVKGTDEISQLTEAFKRMRNSTVSALKMLEGD